MKRDKKIDFRSKSLSELIVLLRECELTLLKWNNPVERNIGAFATRGKGHPYKNLKKRISFIKQLIGDKKKVG